jgi:hypothetical protein
MVPLGYLVAHCEEGESCSTTWRAAVAVCGSLDDDLCADGTRGRDGVCVFATRYQERDIQGRCNDGSRSRCGWSMAMAMAMAMADAGRKRCKRAGREGVERRQARNPCWSLAGVEEAGGGRSRESGQRGVFKPLDRDRELIGSPTFL